MNKIIYIFFLISSASLLQAQCDINRHNTTSDTKWMSCDESMSPNSIRGNSHWIQLSLNEFKAIGNVYMWNIADPDHLIDGAYELAIDVSLDGVTWRECAIVTLPIGESNGYYGGEEVTHLDQATAKYILITALSNHGGDCFGLSELKIETVNFPCDDDTVIISDDPIATGVHVAAVSLQSDGGVSNSSEVYLYGEEEVVLLPGFMADASSTLLIDNQPCSN